MKTLIKLSTSLLLLLMLIFANDTYSQSCTSAVIKYSGPANTTQLTTVLNTTDSTDYPLIVQLTSAQKTSLETYVQFSSAGLPTGMSGSDSNITALYSNTQKCSALFSEIFNQRVFVSSNGNGPTITSITMAQFQQLSQGGTLYSGAIAYCDNCYCTCSKTNPDGCCAVGGTGCVDEIIVIQGSLYTVVATQ